LPNFLPNFLPCCSAAAPSVNTPSCSILQTDILPLLGTLPSPLPCPLTSSGMLP
jgi:hypothetical protein